MTKPELEKGLSEQVAQANAAPRKDTSVQVAGQLPHTGFPTLLVAALGLILLALGTTLRYVANGAGVEKIGGAHTG